MRKFSLTFFTEIKSFEIYKIDDRHGGVDNDTCFYDFPQKEWIFLKGDEVTIHWNGCASNLNAYLLFKKGDHKRKLPFKIKGGLGDVEPDGKLGDDYYYRLRQNGQTIVFTWDEANRSSEVHWSFDFYWGEGFSLDRSIDPEAKIKNFG